MLDIERTPGANGRAFRLVGDLDNGVARQLQRILSGPASDGEGLTVDLSGLDSCDTECARLLVTLTKRARIAEGDLVLTSPSGGAPDPHEDRRHRRAEHRHAEGLRRQEMRRAEVAGKDLC